MTRLMGILVLALVAAGGAACGDDNPVAPSSISGAGAFRNEMVFVPDGASICTAKSPRGHGSRPVKC